LIDAVTRVFNAKVARAAFAPFAPFALKTHIAFGVKFVAMK